MEPGFAAMARLRPNIHSLEKNTAVGGTWYENRYPGARVDTGSRTYTHIFGADFPYPSPYCPQSENEKYLNWVADHFEIRQNIANIGVFVMKQTVEIQIDPDPAKLKSLIDINCNLAAGLSGRG